MTLIGLNGPFYHRDRRASPSRSPASPSFFIFVRLLPRSSESQLLSLQSSTTYLIFFRTWTKISTLRTSRFFPPSHSQGRHCLRTRSYRIDDTKYPQCCRELSAPLHAAFSPRPCDLPSSLPVTLHPSLPSMRHGRIMRKFSIIIPGVSLSQTRTV